MKNNIVQAHRKGGKAPVPPQAQTTNPAPPTPNLATYRCKVAFETPGHKGYSETEWMTPDEAVKLAANRHQHGAVNIQIITQRRTNKRWRFSKYVDYSPQPQAKPPQAQATNPAPATPATERGTIPDCKLSKTVGFRDGVNLVLSAATFSAIDDAALNQNLTFNDWLNEAIAAKLQTPFHGKQRQEALDKLEDTTRKVAAVFALMIDKLELKTGANDSFICGLQSLTWSLNNDLELAYKLQAVNHRGEVAA